MLGKLEIQHLEMENQVINGVVKSFSRPQVVFESMLSTMKYRPESTYNGCESLGTAREWVQRFVYWYNEIDFHSVINFVTPSQFHSGKHIKILKQRDEVYKKAKENNPQRWSKSTRN